MAGANFQAAVHPLRRDAADRNGIVKQGVMESHLPPDHGRQWIVRQYNPVAVAVQPYGDRGSDLIGAEDHRETV